MQIDESFVDEYGKERLEKYLQEYLSKALLKLAAQELLEDLKQIDIQDEEWQQARARAFHVLDSLQVLSLCTNLGDTKTLLAHPASTSHGRMTEDQRQAAGIGQGLIRMSVGLEHLDDIKNDLLRGLNTL